MHKRASQFSKMETTTPSGVVFFIFKIVVDSLHGNMYYRDIKLPRQQTKETMNMLTKESIEKLAREKSFIHSNEETWTIYSDLNGFKARKFLENRGFVVIKNYNTGRNGLAITECGIHLSTNGYIYK